MYDILSSQAGELDVRLKGLSTMKMLTIFLSTSLAIASIAVNLVYARDIYINKDSKRSIMKLKGAGKRIGNALIEDRDMNGPYWSLEDLQRVGVGMGPKWCERAGDKIVITPEYRCWQCGMVIKLNPGEKEGICPYCKYEWPKKVFLQKKKDKQSGRNTDAGQKDKPGISSTSLYESQVQ